MSASVAAPAPGGIFSLPLIGAIARDIDRDINTIFYLLTIFVTLVTLAVVKWGLVALALTAVAAVPVVFILLILITLG